MFCARVWVLDGGHAVYALRGFGLSVLFALSHRALMAGLLPAAHAGGGNEGTQGIGGIAGSASYRGGALFSRS